MFFGAVVNGNLFWSKLMLEICWFPYFLFWYKKLKLMSIKWFAECTFTKNYSNKDQPELKRTTQIAVYQCFYNNIIKMHFLGSIMLRFRNWIDELNRITQCGSFFTFSCELSAQNARFGQFWSSKIFPHNSNANLPCNVIELAMFLKLGFLRKQWFFWKKTRKLQSWWKWQIC